MARHSQTWSMDQFFISNVNALIQQYVDADFRDDMESMFKALKNLEIIVSPKIKDTTEEHKSISWIRDNMPQIFAYDNQGKVIGVNPINMTAVRKVLDETYRNLLLKLEKEKIYTGDIVDPNKSMGYFQGS